MVGFLGILVGGILYALSFAWVKANILPVWPFGKVRLSEVTGIPEWSWFAALLVLALVVFRLLGRFDGRPRS